VPDEWRHIIHFFNVPVTADRNHPDNPSDLLAREALPSDFVAVKLDIDNTPLELALMDQFGKQTDIIDELFFEYHFDSELTHRIWGKTDHGNLSHALDMFGSLRERGVRAHIWP
jgi:hypothetical protein